MGKNAHLFVYLTEKHYFCRMKPLALTVRPIIILLLLTTTVMASARDKDTLTSIVLNRTFSYGTTMDSTIEGHTSTAYLKYLMKTEKRNLTLYCVPHLYVLAKAQNKSHVGEIYATLSPTEARR